MRARGIDQHQRVIAGFVLEIIINALMLHEPADEVERRLAILDAILPRLIASGERVLDGIAAEAVIAEDLLDDVGRGHLLEDAAIRRPRQHPEPRPQHRAIAMKLPEAPGISEVGADAVEVPVAAGGWGNLDTYADRRAQDLRGVDRRLRAQ